MASPLLLQCCWQSWLAGSLSHSWSGRPPSVHWQFRATRWEGCRPRPPCPPGTCLHSYGNQRSKRPKHFFWVLITRKASFDAQRCLRQSMYSICVCMHTYWEFLSIEKHFNAFRGSSYIVGPPCHQSHSVFIQDGHFELGQIWPEGDACVLIPIKRFDARFPCLAHVVKPRLQHRKKYQKHFSSRSCWTIKGGDKGGQAWLTCLKDLLDSRHAVSTVNLVLKMLQSLAP